MLGPVIERRNKDAVMGLGEHLEDLRRRVIYALIAVVPIFAVSLYFGQQILEFLTAPVMDALHGAGQSRHLQATGLLESFASYVKVSAVLTLLAAGPWVVFQLWKFVAPGLYSHERRFAYLLAPMSGVLSIVGAAFAYYVMLPVMLLFLVNFGASIGQSSVLVKPVAEAVVLPTMLLLPADPPSPTPGQWWVNTDLNEIRICMGMKDQIAGPDGTLSGGVPLVMGSRLASAALIEQVPRVAETVDLLLMMGLSFSAAFQTPVVVLLLGWAGIVKPAMLSKYRKHVIAVCAVLSAVLTPSPDPFSMMLLLVPMYGLYELGVLLLRILPATKVAGAADPASVWNDEDLPGGPATGP